MVHLDKLISLVFLLMNYKIVLILVDNEIQYTGQVHLNHQYVNVCQYLDKILVLVYHLGIGKKNYFLQTKNRKKNLQKAWLQISVETVISHV